MHNKPGAVSHLFRVSLSLILVLSLIPVANAAPEGPSPVPSRVDATTRRLHAGDQLEIHIATLPEIEKKYTIRADGTFFHPFAGEVPAAGKTLTELQALLRQRFSRQLRNPSFRIGLTSTADAEVAVLGEVKVQGKVRFTEGASVMEVLAQAGGLTEKADPDTAVLWRSGRGIKVNLSPSAQGDLSKMLVENGDILYINKGRRVGVSGEVQQKGVYAIGSEVTNPVAEAIKNAGGALETAALNRVQIIRATLPQPLLVNLLDASKERLVLEDGDMVLVPPRRAAILGAVAKQGAVSLTGKETILDVISQVGVNQGRLDQVVVIRAADVASGTDKKEVLNLSGSLSEGEKPVVNTPIFDGDVVYVPPKDANQGLFNSPNGLMNLLLIGRSLFGV